MVVVASPGVELCTIRDENSAGSLEKEIPVGVGRDSAIDSEKDEKMLKVLDCECDPSVAKTTLSVTSTELGVRVSSKTATDEVANTNDGRAAEEEKTDVTRRNI